MTVQAWGAAAAIVVGSLLLGHAVSTLGLRCRAASPAVGLSLLILVASIAIKLPGTATTAAIVLLVVLLAAGVTVVARRPLFPRLGLAVTAIAGFCASIPFIANGRVGLLGVSLDNDTATHMVYAEALRSSVTRQNYGLPSGYPLGPHSLAAAVSTGLGVRLDLAFTGLLIATVIVTALVAAEALCGESAWKRLVAGVLAAVLYLVAAYYAEGAFKEPLIGLLLLAMVLQLEAVRSEWTGAPRRRLHGLIPASLLVAAGVLVYSYPALVWFGLTVVIWLAAEAVARPGWLRHWRAQLLDVVAPGAIAALVLLVLLAPFAGRILNFAGTVGVSPAATGAITTSNVGNLASSLSPYEALGVWNSPDFRFLPPDVFHAGELSALALGVLILGLGWSLARRELLLPAAVVACAIVYWRANQGQSPYVTAKALVIAGPVVAVTGLRGLLRAPRARLTRWLSTTRLGVAAVFVVLAAHSSYEVLRDEPVWPSESTRELLSLDKLTRGQTLLFLGNTDYAEWLFHDSDMSALAATTTSLGQAALRPTKPFVYGTPLDFDSVSFATLGRFRWVITTNTPYASQAPAGFRLARQLRMYELWERVGPIVPRDTLESPGVPGFVLNCRSPVGRALSRRGGVAAVMAPPILAGMGAIAPGGVEPVAMKLPAGTWGLSLQYASAVDLDVTADGRRWRMPAYLDRPGPVFSVGTITSAGSPVTVTVHADRPSSLTGPGLEAMPAALLATRLPDVRTLVPLRRACGRYIDWYHF